MRALIRHWPRILVTLIPLVIAVLHVLGVQRIEGLSRLDDVLYDARLRATNPKTLDQRIVIIDIDEKSLAEVGRWPWGRHHMARLVDELVLRQNVAVVGFDVVFAEPDDSSGLKRLRQLAEGPLRDQPGFAAQLTGLQDSLDYDALFAKSLQNRPVVLGYYFSNDSGKLTNGQLPAPTMAADAFADRRVGVTRWNGYGANIAPLAQASPMAGFFNSITESDGVVRAVPLIAEFDGQYYEALSLAIFRTLRGMPTVSPGYAAAPPYAAGQAQPLDSVVLRQGANRMKIPVDDRVATLVPFRGPGGPNGGSFRYVSAADLLGGRIAPGTLKGQIALVGTTAPGLLDVRVTPVGEIFPGVEIHANVISGLLDGRLYLKPDYAAGYELLVLVLAGLTLAVALPLLTASRAVLLSVVVIGVLVGLNVLLFFVFRQVLPLATSLAMALTAFALNMSYGYFVESRSKRELANLFGTYVPPELVDEMVKHSARYSMRATSKELTVMFCDMRGFTKMSETMEPTQLQALLNSVFSRLTTLIRNNRGTIDKYMGDCVMAFWGAPVETADHPRLAVKTALEMAREIGQINDERRARKMPEISVGIGLNTGNMCVGDMGSNMRRSYTVIGDAVNLGARLEALSKLYGVDLVVSEHTQKMVPQYVWQELDRVRVRGKAQAVAIYTPLGEIRNLDERQEAELTVWNRLLAAYRAQDWDACDVAFSTLRQLSPQKQLYRLYTARVDALRQQPFNPDWDATSEFETQ